MQTEDTPTPQGSPAPGIIPAPVQVETASDPETEREARRRAREQERGPASERAGVMIPNRRDRLPLEAPLMRVIATGGIVGLAVAVAAILGTQDIQAWLIGLVASVLSLALAAVLWSSRRL